VGIVGESPDGAAFLLLKDFSDGDHAVKPGCGLPALSVRSRDTERGVCGAAIQASWELRSLWAAIGWFVSDRQALSLLLRQHG